MNEHMKRAANAMGSAAALASAIQVSPQFMSQMIRGERQVPAEQCPNIEALTGVRCEDLRPDVNWAVLRAAPVTTEEQGA